MACLLRFVNPSLRRHERCFSLSFPTSLSKPLAPRAGTLTFLQTMMERMRCPSHTMLCIGTNAQPMMVSSSGLRGQSLPVNSLSHPLRRRAHVLWRTTLPRLLIPRLRVLLTIRYSWYVSCLLHLAYISLTFIREGPAKTHLRAPVQRFIDDADKAQRIRAYLPHACYAFHVGRAIKEQMPPEFSLFDNLEYNGDCMGDCPEEGSPLYSYDKLPGMDDNFDIIHDDGWATPPRRVSSILFVFSRRRRLILWHRLRSLRALLIHCIWMRQGR